MTTKEETKMSDITETIEIDIDDELFLIVAKMANENDLTFNQMVIELLENYLHSIGADKEFGPDTEDES